MNTHYFIHFIFLITLRDRTNLRKDSRPDGKQSEQSDSVDDGPHVNAQYSQVIV